MSWAERQVEWGTHTDVESRMREIEAGAVGGLTDEKRQQLRAHWMPILLGLANKGIHSY